MGDLEEGVGEVWIDLLLCCLLYLCVVEGWIVGCVVVVVFVVVFVVGFVSIYCLF